MIGGSALILPTAVSVSVITNIRRALAVSSLICAPSALIMLSAPILLQNIYRICFADLYAKYVLVRIQRKHNKKSAETLAAVKSLEIFSWICYNIQKGNYIANCVK